MGKIQEASSASQPPATTPVSPKEDFPRTNIANIYEGQGARRVWNVVSGLPTDKAFLEGDLSMQLGTGTRSEWDSRGPDGPYVSPPPPPALSAFRYSGSSRNLRDRVTVLMAN